MDFRSWDVLSSVMDLGRWLFGVFVIDKEDGSGRSLSLCPVSNKCRLARSVYSKEPRKSEVKTRFWDENIFFFSSLCPLRLDSFVEARHPGVMRPKYFSLLCIFVKNGTKRDHDDAIVEREA